MLCYSAYSVLHSSSSTVFSGSIYVALSSTSDPFLLTAVWTLWGGGAATFCTSAPTRMSILLPPIPWHHSQTQSGHSSTCPLQPGWARLSLCPGVDCWDTEYAHTYKYFESWGVVNVFSDGGQQGWGVKGETELLCPSIFRTQQQQPKHTLSMQICKASRPRTEMHRARWRLGTDMSFSFMSCMASLSF